MVKVEKKIFYRTCNSIFWSPFYYSIQLKSLLIVIQYFIFKIISHWSTLSEIIHKPRIFVYIFAFSKSSSNIECNPNKQYLNEIKH